MRNKAGNISEKSLPVEIQKPDDTSNQSDGHLEDSPNIYSVNELQAKESNVNIDTKHDSKYKKPANKKR